MDKEKIIIAVLDKLKLDDLFKDLESEDNPQNLETKFREFLDVNKLQTKDDIQPVFAHLKAKGLFKEQVKTKELHDIWLKLRNELARGFLIEN